MGWRAVISLTSGRVDVEHWMDALLEEPPTEAKPVACSGCPLRKDGEWEPAVADVLPRMAIDQRDAMKRWTCHADLRPCAGMLRLVKAAEVAPAQGGPKGTR